MKGTDLFAALILLFFIGTPVLVLVNPSFIKNSIGRRKAGIIGLVLFFASFIGFGMSSDKEKTATTPTTKVASQQQSTSPTIAVTKARTPTPSVDDMVKAAAKKNLGDNKYDIKYDADVKLVTITLPNEVAWDETAMVKGVVNSLVKNGIDMFKIPGVEALSVVRMAEMTDTYGKKNIEKGAQFTIEKEEFQKYDWKNLKGTNVYPQMVASTTLHYVHPGIMKNVDTSKITLFF